MSVAISLRGFGASTRGALAAHRLRTAAVDAAVGNLTLCCPAASRRRTGAGATTTFTTHRIARKEHLPSLALPVMAQPFAGLTLVSCRAVLSVAVGVTQTLGGTIESGTLVSG